jgi:MFS family permease
MEKEETVKDTPRIKELKHQARRKSIKEGIFAVGQSSFGSTYISPFAIAINSSNSLIAMLSSIGSLLGPLSQIFSSRLMEKYSRKKIVLKSVLTESLMWSPLILIAFLYYKNIITNFLPLFLLIIFSLQTIIANIAGPAWFSWMGDIVDEKYRGRWFSKRNLLTGFSSVILAIIASFILDYFKKNSQIMIGFSILFLCALLFRFISYASFKKQYEPKIKLKKGDYFSFWNFLLKAPKTNFGKFSIFRFFYSFACSIASPFIAIYLLRTLNLDYTFYIIVIYAGTIFSLLILELWGKLADRYGNYKIIVFTSIFTPVIPLLWILNSSVVYLILVPSLIGGIAWAGFNLAAGNFIYDNIEKEKRGLGVSYYNMLNGIGIFLGAGVGALLIKFLPTIIFEPIIWIFIIGTFTRMVVVFFGLAKIKEIKKRKNFEGKNALKNLLIKEGKQTLLEEAHQIMSIKRYLTE